MSDQSLQGQNGLYRALQELVLFSRPVEVTFNPTSREFTFVPDRTPMKRSGRVILKRGGTDPQWKFVAGIVKGDSSEQFSSAVRADGAMLHIHDEFRELGTFHYKVVVEFNGQCFMSPDPVIVNEPP